MRWNDFSRGQRCPVCKSIDLIGENHPTWKGGGRNIWYDTYAHQISWCERVR